MPRIRPPLPSSPSPPSSRSSSLQVAQVTLKKSVARSAAGDLARSLYK